MLQVSEMKFIKPEFFPQDFFRHRRRCRRLNDSSRLMYITHLCGRLNEITRIKHRFQRLSLNRD